MDFDQRIRKIAGIEGVSTENFDLEGVRVFLAQREISKTTIELEYDPRGVLSRGSLNVPVGKHSEVTHEFEFYRR